MAAIDKFYTNDKEKAKKLCSFIENAGKVSCGVFNGKEVFFKPSDFLYAKSSEIDKGIYDWTNGYPLWNSPSYMDKWLWHNIDDEDVLDDLRWKYNIEEGMSDEEIDRQFVNIDTNFQVGKHYTIVKDCPRKSRRLGKVRWILRVEAPYEDSTTSWFYNYDLDMFVPRGLPHDFVNQDFYKPIIDRRFLNRFVRKHQLPVGSILTFEGYYMYQDLIVKIRK